VAVKPIPTPKPKTSTAKPAPVPKPSAAAAAPKVGQSSAALAQQSPATIEAQLRTEPFWPELEPLWNIPELQALIINGQKAGWSAQDFQYAIEGTTWFKQTPDTARKWLGLSAADRQVAIDTQVANVTKAARETYWIPMTQGAIQDWATKLASGALDQTNFDAYLKAQAKALFGNNAVMADAIDRGATPQTLLSPYLSVASKELEKPEDQLVGNQSVFGSIYQGQLPTMSQFTQAVRQLPEWRNTQGANDQAAALEKQMLATFGGPKI
jgi:hypothetical protein